VRTPYTRPRERFATRVETVSDPREPTKVRVEILDGDRAIASYDRNYSMLSTFEPFRQGDRDYALISPHYTATSVIDLQSVFERFPRHLPTYPVKGLRGYCSAAMIPPAALISGPLISSSCWASNLSSTAGF